MGKKLNFPWYKKVQSYFYDVVIEQRSSAFNPEIILYLVRNRLQLCCGSAIYSFDDLYDNFGDCFQKINLSEKQNHTVLLLGFGIGSIPYILEKQHQKNWSYTAVEIDEEIIELAELYSIPRLSSYIQMICADAHVFIETTEEKYDLICMDVFKEDIVPDHLKSHHFIEQLKQTLSLNGLLIMNLMADSPASKKEADDFFEAVFKQVFPEAVVLHIHGNYMLLSDHSVLKH